MPTVNPGHETSPESLHIWLHVRSALLGLILIITLVLNTLLIVVLRKMKSRRSKTDCASHDIERSYMYLLLHLALSDMLGVLINIPFGILDNAGVKYNLHQVGCTLLGPLQLACTSAQAGTYVALSYHRFRAIVYPIHANLTVCKSVLMICVIWGVGFCLSLPYAIVNRQKDDVCTEVWPQGTLSSNVYTFSIFFVQYAIPVTLMAIFYIWIAKTLQKHRSAKEFVSTRAQEDICTHRHIVKMLVTIVAVYSVCMLPHNLLWIIDGLRPMGDSTFNISSQVAYLFTYSNTVANPAVFFVYNKESRYHLKQMFRKFCICYRPKLTIPFEMDVNMWSGSWSGNSKSDNNNRSEKRSLRNDRTRLNQLFPAHDSDLGVSLPWEAQVLSSSHDSYPDVLDYGDCDLSTPLSVQDNIYRKHTGKPDESPLDKDSSSSSKKLMGEVVHDKNLVNEDNAFQMEQISEKDEESLSEDDTERVQKLIKEMAVGIKRDMSDNWLYDEDHVSGGDVLDNDNMESSGDILNNGQIGNNGELTNNDGMHKNGDIATNKDTLDNILSNGNVVKNRDILSNGGNCLSQFGDDTPCEDFGSMNEVDCHNETDEKKMTASQDLLVKDMINYLENSPNSRDINELREELWNLPEDDV